MKGVFDASGARAASRTLEAMGILDLSPASLTTLVGVIPFPLLS